MSRPPRYLRRLCQTLGCAKVAGVGLALVRQEDDGGPGLGLAWLARRS